MYCRDTVTRPSTNSLTASPSARIWGISTSILTDKYKYKYVDVVMLNVHFLHAVGLGHSEEVFSVLRVRVNLRQISISSSSRSRRQRMMELKDKVIGWQSQCFRYWGHSTVAMMITMLLQLESITTSPNSEPKFYAWFVSPSLWSSLWLYSDFLETVKLWQWTFTSRALDSWLVTGFE